MKLYHKDKNKGKFQSFVNFSKKTNDTDFSGFTFYKNPYNIFLMFKYVRVGKHVEYVRQKLSKTMLIIKVNSRVNLSF